MKLRPWIKELMIIIFIYLCFAFIQLNLNCFEWNEEFRAIFIMFVLFVVFLNRFLNLLFKSEEKD